MTAKADTGASIRTRLLNRAKAENMEFGLILIRFALERLLYRLSISSYREQFLLKGALLFDLWFDEPHRPTRDADFLGFGEAAKQKQWHAFIDKNKLVAPSLDEVVTQLRTFLFSSLAGASVE